MSKHGWTYKKLGELTTTINGLWTGKKPPFVNVAVVRNTNFTKDCKLDMTNVAFLDVEEKQYATRKLFPGDIIIEKSGGTDKQPVGRPILFNIKDNEYSFSNFTSTLRISSNEIIPSFLHKVLYAKYLQGVTLRMQSKTTGIHNLDFKAYKKILIPILPIEMQESIVAELDGIDETIAELRQQIADLDILAQSTFYDMFGDPVSNEKGWEVKKLKELSNKISNGNTPKGGSQVYVEEGILFLRSQNVWKNRLELDDVAFLDYETHAKMSESSLKHNDILITKTGRVNTENSSLGRAALFTGEDDSANINGHVYLVRLKDGVLHKFILYILISESFRELIRRVCVGGIDKRQLNKNHIADFPIIFPPLAMQQEFVEKFEAIEEAKAELNVQIAEMQTLLASRMDYYFD